MKSPILSTIVQVIFIFAKDEQSNVRVVMFRSRARNLNFKPENGLDCLVRGYISLYPRETACSFMQKKLFPPELVCKALPWQN